MKKQVGDGGRGGQESEIKTPAAPEVEVVSVFVCVCVCVCGDISASGSTLL